VAAERRGNGRGTVTAAATRPAHVYDRLKDAIITGTLRPLERISENKVAADFGLSRTPVRQALQRLEAQLQGVPA
jgi:DNA-binding GntR family transcriptional regulator